MFAGKLKAAVKALPFATNLVRQGKKLIRQARRSPQQKEIDRFRRYCVHLSKLTPEPFFVKVGANDGVTGDPCSDILLAELRWKGLLIEPVLYCFERLKLRFGDTRRFALEQVAVGKAVGATTFYHVDAKARDSLPNLPRWFDQLGSFDRGHIVKHLDGALTPFIVECKVDVLPLTDVLRRNGVRNLHLLHIDTEGHDYEVLKTLDFDEYAPTAIFIEHKHLSAADRSGMLELLRGRGYAVRDCGGDYFALEKRARRPRFFC